MRLARLAYGAVFVVFLPVGLLLWARATSPLVRLPVIYVPEAGAALATLGVLLIAAGIRDLIVLGGGLPMNAFPPPHLVRTRIYRWVRDPIYIGFVLVCAGVSIAAGSPAGLWIVTPVTALACAALVYGYERHDLRRRFGKDALQPPVLSIPPDDDNAASATHRAAVFLWVLIPWVVIFYAVQALGRPADAFGTMLPFESGWTVLQWTELGYVSTYLFIPVTALLIRTQRDLRRFAVQALIAIVVVSIAWLTIPVVATNRPFIPTSALGRLLALEQAHSNGVAAFPAFHVLWALIAAEAWHGNARSSGRNWWGWIGWLWAAIITVTSVTTSMHTVVEVGAAIALFLPIRHYERTWASIRAMTELIANSWKEWRVGPIRIINHGVWGAAGAGVGLLVAGSAAGPDRLGAVIWMALCSPRLRWPLGAGAGGLIEAASPVRLVRRDSGWCCRRADRGGCWVAEPLRFWRRSRSPRRGFKSSAGCAVSSRDAVTAGPHRLVWAFAISIAARASRSLPTLPAFPSTRHRSIRSRATS